MTDDTTILSSKENQMATATPTQQQDIDFPALLADAQQHLEQLRGQRTLLSLPAVVDPTGPEAIELANLESEIASAEQLLSRAELAAVEKDRFSEQERKDAEAKRLTAARAQAEKLGRQLEGEAVEVNQAAAAYAATVAKYGDVYAKRQQHLMGAGLVEWGRGSQPAALGAALRFHLNAAGVLRLLDVRDSGPDKPLGE
jgi:hypothetical protein